MEECGMGKQCPPQEEKKLTEAMEELEMWKNKVDKAETEKSRLLLEKLSAEATKKQAQKETMTLTEQQKSVESSVRKINKAQEDSILQLQKNNQALMERLKKYEDMLKIKKAEYSSLQQTSMIKADIPETKVRFTGVGREEDEENYEDIVCVFTITQKPSFRLMGGQALITFEKEKVAKNILRLPKCSVAFDKNRMDLKPYSVPLEPSVKFEVQMNVSKRTIRYSNPPPYLPAELRDRLEISFSKPSQGGGEVEEVFYNKDTGVGKITFLNTGVAECLTLKKKYTIDASQEVYVSVQPYFEYQLKRFQKYCGVSKRTVLLDGIEEALDEEDLQDYLEIHFQKPSNYGGEVESIKYIHGASTAEAYFKEDTEETN
ncbi:hypothetical protein SKAU_G00249400 [Synaphobranchus kaupii]|uniref:N-myc-interactor n=1 Tax=Synaphobranchus kaupii TaxID=118154 RepID=A0A9Q1F2S4_SYNKA|nr:hypothetical protein SKAU_G00249400 [Synaphobranchus kaupii]